MVSTTSIRVKVCGLTRPGDAKLAIDLGASAIGVVHVPDTPRYTTIDRAKEVFDIAQPQARVLVVCNAAPSDVANWAKRCGASHVQLCGSEAREDWQAFPVPIIRRVGVDARGLKELKAWRDLAALFVLDHPSSPGGSGKTVDFSLAHQLANLAPCLLAGGLNPENVTDAVALVRPQGVDASSGLEASKGIKDPEKLAPYIQRARKALQEKPES